MSDSAAVEQPIEAEAPAVEEAVEAAPVEKPAKKAAAKKEKKPAAAKKAPKAKPNHPPVSEMVTAAIKTLKERGGSSL